MTTEMSLSIFRFAFPLLMIGFPLVFALLVRTKPHGTLSPDEQSREVRKWTTYLVLATAAAAMVHLIVWSSWNGPGGDFIWMFFFVLWFFIAQPLLQAKDPGWASRTMADANSQNSVEPVRVADLSRRDTVNSVPRWALVVAWLAWVVMLIVSAAMLTREHYAMLVFPLTGGLVWLLVGQWAMRYSATEPEPRDPGGSSQLAAAYERFRRQKQWLWYGCSVSAMFVCSLPTLLIAVFGPEAMRVAIWVGAGGGTLLGTLGGGGVGTWGSLQRAKLNRMYQEACQPRQPSAL